MQNEVLNAFVIEQIENLKGRDITTIDISKKSNFADYMIVCSGNSSRHVKSIAQNVVIECRAKGVEALGVEGNDVGEWSLVDFGNLIVHVMTENTRDLYQLEQLWE